MTTLKNISRVANDNDNLPFHVAVSARNMQIVELLVKLSNEKLKDHCDCVPLVEKNMEENTPLHLALIIIKKKNPQWVVIRL